MLSDMRAIYLYSFFAVAVCIVANLHIAQAQNSTTFYTAKVIQIRATPDSEKKGLPPQTNTVQITSGDKKGEKVDILNGGIFAAGGIQPIGEGDTIVISKDASAGVADYYIEGPYRLVSMMMLFLIFLGLVCVLCGMRGLSAVLGLVFSIFVLAAYVVPQILAGSDPFLVSISAAFVIAIISLYCAHGLNKRTTVALGGTMASLCLAAVLSSISVYFTRLSGMGTEESFFLQMGGLDAINLKGLLLGGIIIGVLGILDDATTGQAAAVDEIAKANPSLSRTELFRRGLSVGREHITSLVNTLALAYAGVSLPLFLLFTVNADQPLWAIVNSEFISEEIVRALVGSISLVLAVPLTTALAAYFLKIKDGGRYGA